MSRSLMRAVVAVAALLLHQPPAAHGYRSLVVEVEIEPSADGPTSADVAERLAAAVSNRADLLRQGEYTGSIDADQGVSVRAPETHAAVDVASADDIRVAAASNLDLLAGGGLTGRVDGGVDIAGRAMDLKASGTALMQAGGMAASSSEGIDVFAAGGLTTAAASSNTSIANDALAQVGGAVSVVSGGDVSVASAGAGEATFAEGMWMSGGYVVLEAADRLSATTNEAEVTGVGRVRVASVGSAVELRGDNETEYVGFVWRSSRSFDEYENTVPSTTDVQEVSHGLQLQSLWMIPTAAVS